MTALLYVKPQKISLKVSPEFNERWGQERIAEDLKTANREIELLERQLGLYRKQKRGLMQKLLTVQIWVKA